ncbi:MAG: hypothetical protein K5829_08235 [Treponema sp.]|nr:hypothetical protein [Treponema sp.]
MLVFLFTVLPIALIFFLLSSKNRSNRFLVLLGIICAALLCIVKALFVFAHRIVPAAFGQNYLFYLMNEYFLPQFILYGLFFLISKDKLDFKLKSYFPLLTSFYALYMPYCIISATESEVYSGFSIFVKPMLYLAMLTQCGLSFYAFTSEKKKSVLKIIISILLLIVYLFVPAIIETLYIMNMLPVLFIIISVIYIALPFVNILIKVIKKEITLF